MRHAFFDLPGPLVLGHRGAAAHAPENTLAGFARGLELGAQVIESDVQSSRDGVPILLHDESLERTTNGEGAAEERSLVELKRLDAGFRFALEGSGPDFPFRGRGIEIPSLEEAFEAFPRARFNLELKSPRPDLSQSVVRLVERFGRASTTLLTSGDDAIMARLRRTLAAATIEPAVGASTGDIVAVVRAAQGGEPPPGDAMALQIPTEFGGRPLVTPELIRHAHQHDIQIHVWTINDPDEMDALFDLGVDGIVSDFPERVVARVERRHGRD
jgi:glycerophosphoryl diester phosphodiesterase